MALFTFHKLNSRTCLELVANFSFSFFSISFFLSHLIFHINFHIILGACALYSQTAKKDYRNHTEIAEATLLDHVADQTTPTATPNQIQALRTSRSLEMRLAMNNDILGDEDLVSYIPGPNVTTFLVGRDLSSYHRMSGRDIIMNRIMDRRDTSPQQSRTFSQNEKRNDPLSSYSQQKNSKMDTPILNRKAKQRIWNSSGFVQKGKKLLLNLGWEVTDGWDEGSMGKF